MDPTQYYLAISPHIGDNLQTKNSITRWASFAAITAAISSSLGRVICFSGAIRPLAITKLVWSWLDR